jgi:hypothetical membrane protein
MSALGKVGLVMAVAGVIMVTMAHDQGTVTGGIWLVIVSLVLILVGIFFE